MSGHTQLGQSGGRTYSLLERQFQSAWEAGFWEGVRFVQQATVFMPEDWEQQALDVANEVLRSRREIRSSDLGDSEARES